LHEAQREWVDPVNNLVSADTSGNIGYLTRGCLPIRSSQAHRQFPAAGWTGENEWTERVPFEQLPQAINPDEGFIATANQKVIPGDEPYIGHQFAVPSRIERIRERLRANDRLSPDAIAAIQADRVSVVARRWAALCGRIEPLAGEAERARLMLAGWDANLLPESGAALLWACVRRELARELFEPIVGAEAWSWLVSGESTALNRMIGGWFANVTWSLDGGSETAPDGRPLPAVLAAALAAGWRAAVHLGGAEPDAWRWDVWHSTNARHTLAASFPELGDALSPRRVAAGGDSDTIQCAAYGWNPAKPFDISALSVYRQVADMADLEHASFVVPGGVCGLPGTEHDEDQLETWRTHRRIPAHHTEGDVAAAAVHTLTLQPA
jgi:penicillin amidase